MNRERLKIGLFSEAHLYKPGGVQEHVRGVYDYLEREHEVCIITPGPLPPEGKRRVKILGKRLELEKIMRVVGSSASAALTYAKMAEIKEFLTEENFDVLHFQAPFGFLGWQILLVGRRHKMAKVATFLVYRRSSRIPLLVNFSIGPFLQRLAANLDARIALSEAAEEFAQKILPGEYNVIPSGVDLERFNPEGPTIKKYSDKTNILFVGRLDRRKGLEFLLQAFAIIKAKLPGTCLIVVGKGPEEEKAKKFVRAQEMKDVEFVGYVTQEDLPRYYRTADVVCFPSWGDQCFGIVLLEAMASGKPIIASDIPGYREVLKGDLGDLLFPPKDSGALTLKILSLLEDESSRQYYAQRSLEAAQEYSWERVGERIFNVYKSTLGLRG